VGDVIRLDGLNRADLYHNNGDGTYTDPNGYFTQLTLEGDGSYQERLQDGTAYTYAAPTFGGLATMTSRADREGNAFHYQYDPMGRLVQVTDTLGRPIQYSYNANSELTSVTDFLGRAVQFQYDPRGNLIGITSPAVTGTPDGNDFPQGKTTRFTYSSGYSDARLNGQLLTVTAPNEVASGGPPRLVYTYDTNSTHPGYTRVTSLQEGGTNQSGVAAGGTITYQYQVLATPPMGDVSTPAFQNTVVDRNGDRTVYQFNTLGNILRMEQDTNRDLRPSDPASYVTTFQYDHDYHMVQETLPAGNSFTYTYDTSNPDRFQQGNLLSVTETPDARGGDQTAITTTYTYEPIYNQIHTMTEARGNDPSYVPQNGGATSAARYTTTYTYDYQEGTNYAALGATLGISAAAAQARLVAAGIPMGLGDVNGDGVTNGTAGNLIRVEHPSVTLLPGSNEAAVEGTTTQPIVERYVYNSFNQLTSYTDPEGNVTTYSYFSEQDPNGDGIIDNPGGNPTTGGYLREMDRDTTSSAGRDSGTNPAPADISNQYFYDAAGNLTREIDGRGITTTYVVNQLNQVVEIIHASAVPSPGPSEPLPLTAFSDVERYFYDYNNNVVLHEVEDRGNTSNVQGSPPAADQPALGVRATGTSTGANTTTTLNDGHQAWTVNQWAGLEVKITSGPGAGQVATIVSNTATQLVLSPTTPWTTVPTAASTYAIYPLLNPDPIGGSTAYQDTVFKYDVMDRRVEMLQEVTGGASPEFLRTRYRYDPNGNPVLTIEPEGTATASVYDERNLLFQITQGAASAPPLARLAANDPTSYDVRGGLSATTTFYYDANQNLIETTAPDDTDGSPANNSKEPSGTSTGSNTANTLKDNNHTWMTNQWQGRTVLIVSGTGAGEMATVASNTAHALTLTTAWAVTPDATSVYAFQGDRTRYVYDGFDRRTSMIDSVGDQTVYQYDPAGNLIRTTHFGPTGGPSPTADGPDVLSGPVSSGGVIQSGNLVNSNLLSATETLYDELGRSFQTSQVLFVNTIPTTGTPDVAEGASDIGKGSLTPGQTDPIPGVSGVTILGRVSDRTEYDRDSRSTFRVQDDLDTSRTFYDGVGRVIETVDAAGNTVEAAYDGNSNVIETRRTDVSQVPGVANEVFLTTNFYDSLDRLQQTVDNLGESASYRYDSRNNLVATADADGPVTGSSITRRAFPDGPRTVDTTNDFGNVTRSFYDGIDRLVRREQVLTASGQGDGVHIGASIYGVKDDPTAPESFTPTPDPTQGGGDGLIRTGFVYDKNSLLSAMLDDQGNVTVYLYDNLDRRVSATQGMTATTSLSKTTILGPRVIPTPTEATYNNPAVISTAKINTQLAEAASRLAALAGLFPSLANRVDDHPPTTAVTGFDPRGNPMIGQDENGTEVFTRYDAVSRPIAVRVFRAGQHDSFAGDPVFAPAPTSILVNPSKDDENGAKVVGTTKQDFQYDGLGRLTRSTDNNNPTDPTAASTVTDAYDSLSRVIQETQQTGAGPAQAVSSGWRAENLRSSLTYPNGRVEVYTYDHLDRLATVADQGAGTDIADYKYIGPDRVLERDYPINGTRETYLDNAGTTDVGYDGMGRPVQERSLRSDNSLIVGFTYTYDRMGNKLTEGKLHDINNSETYTYDSAYRLIGFQRAPGGMTPSQTSWALDGVGNSTQVGAETRQYSSNNELIQTKNGSTTTNIAYDDNGNQTDDGTYLYAYDFENRLSTVTRKSDGKLIATYSYDSSGRRIRKVVTNDGALNGTTNYYLDGEQEIEERDAANHLLRQFVFGSYVDDPLVLDRNLDGDNSATGPADQRLFYYQNALGSVYAVADTSARILEGYLYDAYGKQTVYDPGVSGQVGFAGADSVTVGGASQLDNPFLFTARRLDAETGLYYFRARYENSTQDRFLSRDPFGPVNGPNLYEYAGDSPTYFVDPFGTLNVCKGATNPDVASVGKSAPVARTPVPKNWGRIKYKGGFGPVSADVSVNPVFSLQDCTHCCAADTPRAGQTVTDTEGSVGLSITAGVSAVSWGGSIGIDGFEASVWLGLKGSIGATAEATLKAGSDLCNNVNLYAKGCFAVSPFGSLAVGGEASLNLDFAWRTYSVKVGLTGTATVKATWDVCVQFDMVNGLKITGVTFQGVTAEVAGQVCLPWFGCYRVFRSITIGA
jgi:RHS repeat-associated protein